MRANHYALLATTLTLLACSCSLAIMHDSQVSLLSVLFVFLLPTLLVALASTILLSAAPTLFERAAVSPSGQMTSAADEPASKDEADVTETAVKEDKADAKDAADTKEAGSPKTRWKKIEQIWDEKMYDWMERKKAEEKTDDEDRDLLFKALHRTYRFDDQDGYTLLQLSSTALVKVLRGMPDIKDQEELWAEDPSVQARDVFLFSPELRAEVARRKEVVKERKSKPSASAVKTEDAPAKAVEAKPVDDLGEDAEEDMTIDQLEESIDHLSCLLDFIDKDFSSTKQKLDHLEAQSKISFRLLWTLYKPGSVAVSVHSTTEDKVGIKVARAVYTKREEVEVFLVSGTTLEWQGEKIFRNHVTRIIPFFAGLRRLNQLSIYPVTPKLREELTERGRRYMTYIGEPKYVSYKGALVQRVGRDIIKTRAEGRCVADMANYRRLNPGNDLWDGDDEYDESSDLGELPKSGEKVDTTAIPEEDLCLTPPTIFGFSLVLKEWGELDYEQFSPIEFDDKAWDHLELDPHYKKLIRAMVEASCAEDKASRVVKDVIRGKGQGLIALLHGRPGTGKTLTSESIAELLKRPLYSISAGELGIEARSLERSLRDTLELAKSWRAVLLIDEADVILEARSQHEIQRNGLVSIFLRLLEYFEGVLILTTNRIKTFDEAALSRCSIAMRYPDLDLETRKAIWSKFLKLANVDVGKAQTNGVVENGAGRSHLTKAKLQEFASKSINGREIKQVIRTAQALAMSDERPLDAEHIEIVLKMQDQFTQDFKTFDQEGMYKAKGEGHGDTYLYH